MPIRLRPCAMSLIGPASPGPFGRAKAVRALLERVARGHGVGVARSALFGSPNPGAPWEDPLRALCEAALRESATMGRRGHSWARKVKLFLARLKKSDLQGPPQPRLLDKAGRLCQGLQRSPHCLEKLVEALAQGRHWGAFLTDIRVVQASVLVHLRKRQYGGACLLLESCRAMEKEELVRLWNEVHYRQMMERRLTPSLTAVQKFRCRKRHPPPSSFCPGGVKSRNYSEEVRQTLKCFAREVTAKPTRRQRELLAQDTNLQPQHLCNWFANYRRRQAPQPRQGEEPVMVLGAEDSISRGPTHITPVAGGFPEDAGLEQTEQNRFLDVGSPSLEQGSLGSEVFLALPSSSLQSAPLEGFGPSMDPATHHEIPEPAVSCPQTEAKSGVSLSTPTALETEWKHAGCSPGLWTQGPVGCPCGSRPAQPLAEGLPGSRPVPETAHKEVQCSLWSWDASCEGSGSTLQGSPGLLEGTSRSPGMSVMRTVQADLEIEGLVLRESWPGSLGPYRAMLGPSPCCPGSPVPSSEESQATAQLQVLWDSAGDPLAPDTLWAAWLLCEFSSNGRV